MRHMFLLVILAAVPGCNPVMTANGGYFSAFSDRAGHKGAALDAWAGGRTSADSALSIGAGFGIRSKFGEELIQVSLTEELLVMPYGHVPLLTPFFNAGLNVFQFESVDGEFGYGMFSPFSEAGVMIRVAGDGAGRGTVLTLSGGVEYDLRFTSQPNEAYYSLMLGLGYLDVTPPPPQP